MTFLDFVNKDDLQFINDNTTTCWLSPSGTVSWIIEGMSQTCNHLSVTFLSFLFFLSPQFYNLLNQNLT